MGFYHAAVPTDHRVDDQWYLKRMNLFNAHQHTKGDEAIKIGIIDLGMGYMKEVDDSIVSFRQLDDNFSVEAHGNPESSLWGSGGWHCDRIVGIIGSAANTGHGITGIAPDRLTRMPFFLPPRS